MNFQPNICNSAKHNLIFPINNDPDICNSAKINEVVHTVHFINELNENC